MIAGLIDSGLEASHPAIANVATVDRILHLR